LSIPRRPPSRQAFPNQPVAPTLPAGPPGFDLDLGRPVGWAIMSHPLTQLILARLREFYREPEALFWVYAFPVLLALALGLAFSTRAPEPSRIDVQDVPGTDAAALVEFLAARQTRAEAHTEEECRQRLRIGKTALYVVPWRVEPARAALASAAGGVA